MGRMLVRNLDDAVIGKPKRNALERGASLEPVAREAMTAAAMARRPVGAGRGAAGAMPAGRLARGRRHPGMA
jgi:plasmid stability protein